MKKSQDPRHLKRRKLVEELFAFSFSESNATVRDEEFQKLLDKLAEIDELITKAAPAFPIEKIAKVDVAILRNAVYELVFDTKEPPKVVIDEAVELAKELGGEGSPAFINGVLGTLYKQNNEHNY